MYFARPTARLAKDQTNPKTDFFQVGLIKSGLIKVLLLPTDISPFMLLDDH